MLNMAKKLQSLRIVSFLLFLSIFVWNNATAQCGVNSFNEGGTLSPTGSWQSVNVGSGTYAAVPVTMNNFYYFRYSNANQKYSNGNNIDMTLSVTSGILPYNDNTTPTLNPWTGGICPPSGNNRPTSSDWFASFTGIINVSTNTHTTGNVCAGWVSGQNSATLQYKTCPGQPDPGVGNNQWNIEAFATANADVPNPAARYGYYTTTTTSLNTTADWSSITSPSSASTWNGCEVPTDKFSVRARRKGFTCQPYTLTLVNADDDVRVLLNGNLLYTASCCASNVALGTFVLSANDVLEVRFNGLCGGDNVNLSLTPVAVPTVNGGAIGGVTNGTNVCSNAFTSLNFTNTTAASSGVTGFNNGGTFTYTWESSNDNITFLPISGASGLNYTPTANLPVGTYYVRRRATDACGNSNVSNVISINVVPLPVGTISPSNQAVCSGSEAVFTFNSSVGIAPFILQFTDGVNTYVRNGKNSGDTVKIPISISPTTVTLNGLQDANGCGSNPNSSGFVTISPVINVSGVTSTNISCFGGNDGTITVTASGGTPPFQYSADNGLTYQSSNVITSLAVGSYNVVVKDALGCTQSYGGNPVVLTQPTQLTISSVSQDASCSGVYDGEITVTAGGGTLNYSYSLNGGPLFSNPVISGLGAGVYTVMVTDAKGCTASLQDTIGNSYTVTASVNNQVDVSCFGGNDGTFTLSMNGGIPAYQYSINGGLTYQNSPTFSSLTAGNYLVKIIDSKGCPVIQNVAITQPAKILTTIDSVTNATCYGSSTASIYVTTQGGTPSYTFIWNNGTSTEDNLNVSAGNYRLTVVDSKGCSDSVTAVVGQPTKLFVTLASATNVSCNGGIDGTVDITVGGGTLPYSFAWSNGQTGEDLVGIVGGTYTVTVTDANGCFEVLTQTITEPQPLGLTLTSNNIICNGAKNGNINTQVTGGTTPYRYFWNTGDTTANLSGVGGGLYTVIVTDANDCSTSGTVTLTEPPVYSLTLQVTNVLCNGDSTGSITANAGGGTPPYTYVWSNGGSTQTVSNLKAGIYTVTVSDVNGCSSSASAVVNEPAALVLNSAITDVTCAGFSNGSVDISVGGGIFPYTYLWSNSATTQDLNNAMGGNYSLTVTDANGCTTTQSFTVSEPQPIAITFTKTDLLCFGAQSGSATASVAGGTAPYNYLWSNFNGTNTISNVAGGTYSLIVTDSKGCQSRDSVTINEPAAIAITANVQQITCYNANDGVIDLTVNGGTPGFTYAWSNSATTQDLTSLGDGTYVVVITDANNCTATAQYTIVNPSPIIVTKFITTPKCSGDSDGKIDLIPSGGEPPYTFAWSNTATTEDIFNVATGTYVVTVTDSRGCSLVDTSVVGEPKPLFTTGFVKDVTCNGYADGFLDITAYGGTLPYYFLWSKDSIITEDIGSLQGGTYFVTVTDGNGCTVSGTYFVYEPTPLTLTFTSTNVTCPGSANGTITPTVAGGNYPYNYTWSNFSGDSLQTGLTAGTYILAVEDFKGCKTRDSVRITQPLPFNVAATIVNASCSGKSDGSIKVVVTGANGNYTYAWSNSATSDSIGGLAAGTYTLTVTDAQGCTFVQSFNIVESKQLIADVGVVNPACNGATTGIISIDVTGGDAPYTYLWSTTPAQTNNTASNLADGSYTVTITDSKGCSITETRTIATPSPLSVSVNVTGSRCANIGTGVVQAVVQGGAAPFVYILNGTIQANDSFVGLLPGNYVLLVRDANGCEGVHAFNIPMPSPLEVDLTSDKEVILSGMEVQLTANVTSDTTVIAYRWQPLGTFSYSNCNDTLNCANPTVMPLITTTFAVTVENAFGCKASDTLRITVKNQPSVFLPTAFTPNGDGLNDRFEFDILGVKTADVKIYDRWGNLIFEKANQQNGLNKNEGWDGTFKGTQVQFDTYVYTLVTKYFDGTEKTINGTVAIMK